MNAIISSLVTSAIWLVACFVWYRVGKVRGHTEAWSAIVRVLESERDVFVLRPSEWRQGWLTYADRINAELKRTTERPVS